DHFDAGNFVLNGITRGEFARSAQAIKQTGKLLVWCRIFRRAPQGVENDPATAVFRQAQIFVIQPASCVLSDITFRAEVFDLLSSGKALQFLHFAAGQLADVSASFGVVDTHLSLAVASADDDAIDISR